MVLRSIPKEFSASVVEQIDDRLTAVETEQRVHIALAIESGSRAWGFPSPNSDYDCRFVFIRSIEQYLTPWPPRDVIETPLDRLRDVNGWDLGKALKLVLKGNAVIIEWVRSPIVYRGDPSFRQDLLDFATAFANRIHIGRHYLHLGERQRRTYFADEKQVQLKKIFYALRPAATLRWLRLRPDEVIPPMHFPTLMAEGDPPADVVEIVRELLDRKAKSRELGVAPLPKPIQAFIDGEFTQARNLFEGIRVKPKPDAIASAEALFRRYAYHWEA